MARVARQPRRSAEAPCGSTIKWFSRGITCSVAAASSGIPRRRRLKPHRQLATAPTPDGALLTLHEHDGTFSIRVNGHELMHSSMSESERELGTLTAERVPTRGAARVLVGGLGLGFTLRAVLDGVGREASVEVAELVPAIVEWNRGVLGALHGGSLGDGRVRVFTGDVFELLARSAPARFDAIALDIDNGPSAMVQRANARLYHERGVALLARALKPGGRLVVWSAGPDRAFERRVCAPPVFAHSSSAPKATPVRGRKL